MEEGDQRVKRLETMDDFFKPAIAKGARLMHHKQETVESAHEIVRSILKNHPIPLTIQEEIVDQGKDIDKTNAGVEVDKKLAALAETYEKKLKEQLEAAEQARREHDEETRKELLEESKKAQDAIAKLAEERATQAEEYKRLQREFEQKREEAEAQRAREETFRKRIEAEREQNRQAYQKQQARELERVRKRLADDQRRQWNLVVSRKERALHSVTTLKPGHRYFIRVTAADDYELANENGSTSK